MISGRLRAWGTALLLLVTAANTLLLLYQLQRIQDLSQSQAQADARATARADADLQAEIAAARVAVGVETLDAASLPAQRALAARLSTRGGEAAQTGRALEFACLHAEKRWGALLRRGRQWLDEQKTPAPWIRWRLGLALLARDETPQAIAELEQVVGALPDFVGARHRLGTAYVLAGRREDALRSLARAVSDGAGPKATLDLARNLVTAARYTDALPHLETVLGPRPKHAEALRLLAKAHFQLDHPGKAGELYERSWQAKADPRTLLSAIIAWRQAGDDARALDVLDRGLPAAKGMPAIHFQRAGLLFELRRNPEAMAELRRYMAVAQGLPGEAQRIAEARRHLSADLGKSAE